MTERTLDDLVARCKAEVTVLVNEHTTEYMSIGEWFTSRAVWSEPSPPELIARCEAAGSVAVVQAYPDTPVGSYTTVAPTASEAIHLMHQVLDDDERARAAT